MKSLEIIKEKYSKLYPQFDWKIIHCEKKSYCPASVTLYFESSKLFGQRFVAINIYEDNSNIVNKFGKYQIQIYLHPILTVYDEPCADQNPTISKYIKNEPTEQDILLLINKKESTYFNKK